MRLYGLAFAVWIILIPVVSIAILVGHCQKAQTTLDMYGFNMCNDKLCFLGIEVGVTRWSKALAILESHRAKQRTLQEDVYFIGNTRINIDYNPQTQLVTYIAVVDQSGGPLPITAGDIIDYLGAPCTFGDTFQAQGLVLYYGNASVTLEMDSLHLNPSTQIKYVDLPGNTNYCSPNIGWPGFTTFDRYQYVIVNALSQAPLNSK